MRPARGARRDRAAHRADDEVLLRLETVGLPAVSPAAIAESPERGTAILATEYLAHSLQYRRLLMRLPPGPSVHRDRLLDAWWIATIPGLAIALTVIAVSALGEGIRPDPPVHGAPG